MDETEFKKKMMNMRPGEREEGRNDAHTHTRILTKSHIHIETHTYIHAETEE